MYYNVYFQNNLALSSVNCFSVVMESGEEYRSAFVNLADGINDRLSKAEALLTMMHSSHDLSDEVISESTLAILDLVQGARTLYHRQWEKIRERCIGNQCI